MKLSAMFLVVLATGAVLVGCHHDDDILSQMAAAKKLPPPTPQMLQNGFARVQARQQAAIDAQKEWLKQHPDKAAQYNADMAARGAAPVNP
jgi:hypothetical protein